MKSDFTNYNNITVKRINKSIPKICNICYGFARYSCCRCNDKYCSVNCYKSHTETKCVKYAEL